MLTLYEIDMLRIAQKLVIGVDEEQEQDEKLPIVAFYLKNRQHFLDPVKTKLSCFLFYRTF